jgi:hypothetical protein
MFGSQDLQNVGIECHAMLNTGIDNTEICIACCLVVPQEKHRNCCEGSCGSIVVIEQRKFSMRLDLREKFLWNCMQSRP